MVLIIGGAYQGKGEYALATLECGEDQLVRDVHLLILSWLDEGLDPVAEVRRRAEDWGDKAVLLEDISCGVVPLSARERAWREAVGRAGAYLSRRAEKVVRMFCGIGTVIKE